MVRRKPGRPTKCTPKVAAAIAARIAEGTPQETAAQLEGIAPRTFHGWMARGEEGESPYEQFSHAVTRARSQAQEALVAEVRAGLNPKGDPDWKARAWLLERMFPERFGQTVQVRAKVDSELKDVIARLREGLDPATFRRVAELLTDGAVDGAGAGEARGGGEGASE